MRVRGMLLVVAVTVLGACGGSGDDESGATTEPAAETTSPPESTTPAATDAATTVPPATTEPPTTDPTATTAPPETTEPAPATLPPVGTPPPGTEAELAAWALLTLEEMPAGWMETPYDPSQDSGDDSAKVIIAECTGLDPTLISDDVLGDTKAKSGEFASPDTTATVQQSVGFAVDVETATAAILALGDESVPGCYVEALTQRLDDAIAGTDPATSMPEGVTLTDVTVEPIDLTGILPADEGVWYAGKITLDFQGQAIESFVDLIWIRNGRALTNLELGGDGVIFPDELIGPIAARAQEKLAAVSTAAG